MPKLVVSDYGGERSDAGSLGTGIYFGKDASTSIKYSSPGQSRGSRFLLICDVALGKVKVLIFLEIDLLNLVISSLGFWFVSQPYICAKWFKYFKVQ